MLRSRPVRPVFRRRALLPAALAAAAAAALVPALGVAQPTSSLLDRADALSEQEQAAVLELYAAETALGRARAAVARRTVLVRAAVAEEESARRRADVVRRSLEASQRRVARALRALYIEGEPDLLAVLLGAESLDAALTGIDSLAFTAEQNRRLADEARERGARLAAVRARLTARRGALERARADAAAAARGLEATVAARSDTLAAIRRETALTRSRIAALEAQAAAARLASERIARAAPSPPVAEPAEQPDVPAETTEVEVEATTEEAAAPATARPGGTRTLVVDAVAYHLPGRTASGLPVGPGVIAVDPRVIPLGTRVFVPGYGPAIAADTGTAIIGNIIDLWMPSTAEARAWGRRTVEITIYG